MGGADDGLDIRATEVVVTNEADADEGADGETAIPPTIVGERLWIFQCKREKTLAPMRLREVVRESLKSFKQPPYGFVIAVACDISKKARDAFRDEMVARGVEEFVIWAKGELEDMLFQAKNDALLFAYFGISIQARRRSLTTTLRSEITKKKQIAAMLGDDRNSGKLVLVRDPSDNHYPKVSKEGEPLPRWFTCMAISIRVPGTLTVLYREHLAALTPDGERWAAIFDFNSAKTHVDGELEGLQAWSVKDEDRFAPSPYDFWNEYISESDKATLKVFRFIPLDRILAIDMIGDGYYPVPHILVEWDEVWGPFIPKEKRILDVGRGYGGSYELYADESKRVEIFPKPLPDVEAPIPLGFDNTSKRRLPISEPSGGKLSAMLETLNKDQGPTPNPKEKAIEQLDWSQSKMQPFIEWRDKIALPVFSEFVGRLRAAGHTARVVVRSAEARNGIAEASEAVELKIKLSNASKNNPRYHPFGSVRYSMSPYSGWQLKVWPTPEAKTDRSGAPSRRPIEEISPAMIEAEVLAVFERLVAQHKNSIV